MKTIYDEPGNIERLAESRGLKESQVWFAAAIAGAISAVIGLGMMVAYNGRYDNSGPMCIGGMMFFGGGYWLIRGLFRGGKERSNELDAEEHAAERRRDAEESARRAQREKERQAEEWRRERVKEERRQAEAEEARQARIRADMEASRKRTEMELVRQNEAAVAAKAEAEEKAQRDKDEFEGILAIAQQTGATVKVKRMVGNSEVEIVFDPAAEARRKREEEEKERAAEAERRRQEEEERRRQNRAEW
jgi:hypothetical protein